MSCVDGCMAEKRAAEAPKPNPNDLSFSKIQASSLATASQLKGSLASMGQQQEIAPPDIWQEEKEFTACPKCRASKCVSYNCRVCGVRFCDKCSSKMDVPPSFERKAKSGPSRVCDPCRYKVVSGSVKLVDRLSGAQGAAKALYGVAATGPGARAPPPPPPGTGGSKFGSTLGAPSAAPGGRRLSAVAKTCSAVGCAAIATGPEGKCGAHGGSSASGANGAAGGAVQKDVKLSVKRESDGSVLAELVLPSSETPLSTIDVLLKKTAPQSESYSFVFRGAPIPEAFHGVFLAKHLGNVVFIRPKQLSALALAAEQASLGAIGAASGLSVESDGVSAVNNPFKRDPVKEAELAAKRVVKPKKEVKVVEFKRISPHVSQAARMKVVATSKETDAAQSSGPKKDKSTSGSNGLPPPPPGTHAGPGIGAAAALTAGGKVDDILKARAKAHFGALG